ncbi:hypothetical protein [Vulcanisaeta distributa]|uniref:Uncharacterized protein n=1 Tax=Vulcanisaeta distributa (strain DSM 14429 / JCM 11212 / NBRC 100878 / IC-017) TaxID=572478 RepID=E1QSP5_VULDI|nr:hypothetical protein [Vulcanisaeta distributa]ADN49562.1 hypothetical protein Vdis_0149 [Vulcanisaeta distributa DSM 14429]
MGTITHIVLQTGNTINATQVVNEVVSTVVSPIFNALLAIGGLALLIGIGMILYNTVEYIVHPTSFGRSGALNEIFGHHKRIIGGALGIWLSIYIIFLIASMIGASSANPASEATYVLILMFKNLANYLRMAIGSPT